MSITTLFVQIDLCFCTNRYAICIDNMSVGNSELAITHYLILEDIIEAATEGRLEDVKSNCENSGFVHFNELNRALENSNLRSEDDIQDDIKERLGTAWKNACENGHLEIAKWLAKIVLDVTTADATLLGIALTKSCEKGHIDVAKWLIENHAADINFSDSNGRTPLTWACHEVHSTVAKFILSAERDVNVNVADHIFRNTALHYVIWYKKNGGHTELILASNEGDTQEVIRLRCNGHDIDEQDNRGLTPLHWASSRGHRDVVKALMEFGANEKIIDDMKQTPAQVAERDKHKELLEWLDEDKFWNKNYKMSVLKKITIGSLVLKTLLPFLREATKERQSNRSNDV